MKYLIHFEGTAEIEAESEDEARDKFFDGEIIQDEYEIVKVEQM